MIPFASQRGLGQDLASHLLNEHDNEYMDVAEVRGAVARDLHGAFAEWEAQAHGLTRCKNYLYSLSINPDQTQGNLTRAQYFEYIDRAEERLGLTAQPRAVVFHIKQDENGNAREHCHVVWSRINPFQEKAIHMAFDHDKLMMVTREFARDHNLELPQGYFKEKGAEKGEQVSQYENALKRETGLSRKDHIEKVTDIWRACDNAQAFVNALADNGYMLATGKRPYVLVDYYGGMHALPRLIDDKRVRQKDIETFLGKEYPAASLPSVEEAKALVKDHRKSVEAHLKADKHEAEKDKLKRAQEKRRAAQEKEAADLRERQQKDRTRLEREQRARRDTQRREYLDKARQIKAERARNRPTGLAAFLGRVTGVALIRRKLRKREDSKRLQSFQMARENLKAHQRDERLALQRAQEMQSLAMNRQIARLAQVEAKELKSFDEMHCKKMRVRARGGRNQMPSLDKTFRPRGRRAAPHKSKHRHYKPLTAKQAEQAQEMEQGFGRAVAGKTRKKEVDLERDFTRAASGEKGDGTRGSSEGRKPAAENKVRRYGRRRGKGKDLDRER
jgi:hypothetical protein